MKYFLVGLTMAISCAVHAEVGSRHTERAGGFSLCAPKGWIFKEFPGMKYQIAFGPVTSEFSSNINVVDEAFKGALKDYVDANLATLEKMMQDFRLIRRESLKTRGGVKMEKLIISCTQKKYSLRQVFYFLPGPRGRQFVITCSTVSDNGEQLDPIFEESVRTFEFTQ